MKDEGLYEIFMEGYREATRASQAYPPMNSPHEGYSVLFEEVDELWEHVRVKQGKRNVVGMREEAVQIMAMAARFVYDICERGRGQR